MPGFSLLDRFQSVSPSGSPAKNLVSKDSRGVEMTALHVEACVVESASGRNESEQRDRQALRALHQEAESQQLNSLPTSPLTRASTAAQRRMPHGTTTRELVTPDSSTLMRMAVAATTMLATPGMTSPPSKDLNDASNNSGLSPFKSPPGMRELQSLFSPSRARDRQTGARQAQTASGLVTPRRTSRPHASDEAGSGGLTSPTTYRTPDMRRVISTRATPISPAHSEDARQLMFLATHPFSQEMIETEPATPDSELRTSKPPSSKAAGAQYISRSQRNRAAALMRWQKHKEVGHLTCGSGDGRPLQPLDLQQLSPTLSGGLHGAARRRKCTTFKPDQSLDFVSPSGRSPTRRLEPIDEQAPVRLLSPHELPRAAASASKTVMPASSQRAAGGAASDHRLVAALAASPTDAGAQEENDDDETFEPRASKRRRRSSCSSAAPPGSAAKTPTDAAHNGKMRRGAPPGPSLKQDPEEALLVGDFTASDTVWVGVPGRARFSLQRLHGAPHGLPGLALRQVQCAIVPHTDRTSAFYLAMVRASEQVGGLVRSATRPEMALLTASGALAKGACRASLGTFPAVCRGLWRLGVDDATLEALMVHDDRSKAAVSIANAKSIKPANIHMPSPDISGKALQKHVSITEAPDDTAKSSSRSKVAIVRQTA